jgi:hypothetical protein
MKRLSFAITLLLLLTAATAAPVLAAPINCSTNTAACDAIELGGGPYVMFRDNNGRWLDILSPFSIHVDDTSTGQWHSIGDGSLATGQLKILADSLQSVAAVEAFSMVTAQDIFTVTGAPGVISITATFNADGNANLPDVGGALGPGGSATAELCGPGCGILYRIDTFARGTGEVPYVGPIDLQTSVTFDVTIGTPFTMFYRLAAQARNTSDIDMLNTGSLGFVLPQGYTISSLGGYSSLQPTPTPNPAVPEPSTLTLMGLGGAFVVRAVRRRRMSAKG